MVSTDQGKHVSGNSKKWELAFFFPTCQVRFFEIYRDLSRFMSAPASSSPSKLADLCAPSDLVKDICQRMCQEECHAVTYQNFCQTTSKNW